MKFMNYDWIMNSTQSRKPLHAATKKSPAFHLPAVSVAPERNDTDSSAPTSERKRFFGDFRTRQEKNPEGAGKVAEATNSEKMAMKGLVRRHFTLRALQQALARGTRDLVVVRKSDLSELVKSHIESELPTLLQEQRQGSDPMAAARARGAAYKSAELSLAENLSVAKAAERFGSSEKWLNTLRQRGEFYALVPDGQTRKFRYPQWQFDADRKRLAQVLGALSKANVGCWGIHSFMKTPSADIEGLSPQEWILRSDKPLDTLLQAAARHFADDQGAQ